MICRAGGVVIIRLVALVAIRIGDLVIPVHVAVQTRTRTMSAEQREIRIAMIERRRRPGGRGVASGAIVWKLVRRVVWIRGARIVGLMALIAIGIRNGIIAADMTIGTRPGLVRACQREVRCRMVER